MGFISFRPGSGSGGALRFDRPGAVTFRPASSSGTRVGGELSLAHDDGPARTLKVWMTWDALDRLRTELSRHDAGAGDATILHRVLACWGVEQYVRCLRAGTPLPDEGLLLTLAGGPASCEPRRLLQASGLLPSSAA